MLCRTKALHKMLKIVCLYNVKKSNNMTFILFTEHKINDESDTVLMR